MVEVTFLFPLAISSACTNNNINNNNNHARVHLTPQNFQIEYIASSLRTHFLNHLACIDEESALVTEEVNAILSSCTANADLISTRKKKGNAMKEVLAVVRERGCKLKLANPGAFKAPSAKPPLMCGGIGGIPISPNVGGESVFGIKESPSQLASCWLLPNDPVSTAYGDGVVNSILPSVLDSKDSSNGQPTVVNPARCVVKLPYGTAYMLPSEVSPTVSPLRMSDDQLAKRWCSMLSTSRSTASITDPMALSLATSFRGYSSPSGDAELVTLDEMSSRTLSSECEETSSDVETSSQSDMAVDPPTAMTSDDGNTDGSSGAAGNGNKDGRHGEGVHLRAASLSEDGNLAAPRLIRFGDSMFPTPGGRGASLSKLKIQQLRQTMSSAVVGRQTKGAGFLARDPALVLPDGFAEWEEERTDIYRLKGHLMQLKKIIRRQELSRNLFSKVYESAKTYLEKQEEQMNEISTDLDELKRKCAQELTELGITPDKAKAVLASTLSNMNNSTDEPPKPKKKPKAQHPAAPVPNRVSKRRRGGGRGRARINRGATASNDADAGGTVGGDENDEAAATTKNADNEGEEKEEKVTVGRVAKAKKELPPPRRAPKRGRGAESEASVADEPISLPPKKQHKKGRGRGK